MLALDSSFDQHTSPQTPSHQQELEPFSQTKCAAIVGDFSFRRSPHWRRLASRISFQDPNQSRYTVHMRSEIQIYRCVPGSQLRRSTPHNRTRIDTFIDYVDRRTDPFTPVFENSPGDIRETSNQRSLAVVNVQCAQPCLRKDVGFQDAAGYSHNHVRRNLLQRSSGVQVIQMWHSDCRDVRSVPPLP